MLIKSKKSARKYKNIFLLLLKIQVLSRYITELNRLLAKIKSIRNRIYTSYGKYTPHGDFFKLTDSDIILVGIEHYAIARSPVKLKISGLGPCVGVTLYDPQEKIGSLVHSMLPYIREGELKDNPAKFTDSGIEYLIQQIVKKGASRKKLEAKLVGGSSMFENRYMNIGERNIESAKRTLKRLRVPIIAEDTGKNYARTIIFDTSTGCLLIRTIFREDKLI